MKRQESEIGFKFVARGGEGVERVSGRAAAAILGVADASDSQAASANAAASASERQAEAMKKAKAEAEKLTRDAEDNARREIRAARQAAEEKVKAAKDELAARRKVLAEERRNLAVKRSDDPFNEIRAQYTAESARAASRMRNARTIRDEAAGAIVDAPASKRAEYQETIDHYDGVLKKLREEKKIRDGLFRSANEAAIARRAAENATIKAAADAVEAQKAVIETERQLGEEAIINAERTGKDKVAAAKDAGRRIVADAKNVERQLVGSTERAVDKQVATYEKQVDAAESASSRIARYFANVKSAPSMAYQSAFPVDEKGNATGFASFLPKTGLSTLIGGAGGGIADFAKSLVTKGFLPVFGPALMSGIGFAFRGAFSLAGGALSAVSGIALGLAKSVLGIGVAAVKAGGQLVLWLGRTALNALRGVGSFVTSLVGRLTGLAARIAAVSAAAVTAAATFGYKAIGGAADYAGTIFQTAQTAGMSVEQLTTFSAAARRFGVDMMDIRSAMIQFQQQVAQGARDPKGQIGAYFSQIGVSLQDASGRLKGTNELLMETLRAAQGLDETSRINFFAQIFGEDDVGKLQPLFNALLQDAELLEKTRARQAQLGAIVSPVDIEVMKVWKESVGQLTDAFKGLQLAIARQAGPFLARTFREVATFIAEWRETVAYGFGVLFANIRDFALDVMTIVRGGWGGMFDNTADEATQTANAIAYAHREGMAWIRVITQPSIKNRWLIDVREGLAWVRYLAMRALPPIKTFFAALFGNEQANAKLPWVDTLKNGVFYVGRLLRETLLTLGGDDSMVTEFPWLLKLRAALGTAGRLVGEFFYLVTGDSGRVTEFPWLLKLRDRFNSTMTYLKRLWFEAYSAFTGRDYNVATAQFPWIFTLRDAFFKLVTDVKLVWQDLVGIFGGGSGASTTIGQWVVWLQGEFTKAKTTFFEFVTYAQQAWADIQKVLSGDSAGAFNFEALRGVASFIGDLSTAFGIFETVLTGIYRGVEYVGSAIASVFEYVFGWVPKVFGEINGRVVAMTAGLFLLTGVGRLVFGVFAVGAKIIGALGRALGMGGAAAGAIAGASSAAGAAVGGAGAVGAVAALGAATARAGDAAASSVSKWGRLGEVISKVGGLFKKMPWLAKALGWGSVASLAVDTVSDGEPDFWGSMASGIGAGTFLGARAGGWGALAGGVGGAILGYKNYKDDELAQRIAAERQRLGLGPATEAAFDASNGLAAGSTSRAIDELAVGMGSLEAELASIRMTGIEIPGLSGVGGPNSLQAITQMFADIQNKAANGNIPNPAAFAGSYVGMGGYSDPMAIWSQGAMARAQAAAPWNNPAAYGTQPQQPQAVPQTPVTFVLPGGEVVQGYLAQDQLTEARRVSRHYTGRN